MKKHLYWWQWIVLGLNIGIFILQEGNILGINSEYLLSNFAFKNNIICLYKSITCQFIHVSLLHLLVNIVSFIYIVGKLRKYQKSNISLIIYIIGIIVVSSCLIVFGRNDVTYYGNSGAISAILASLLYCIIIEKKRKRKSIKEELDLIFIFFITTFMPGVSIIMHFSGAIAGIIATIILKNKIIK